MRWPTPQDYNEAIQNPASCFSEADLISGTVISNALGLPRADSGNFASVYKVKCADSDWAVRCFLTNREDQEARYKIISDYVRFDNLECTVDFYFVEKGIKVGSRWFPILKMPWVVGETLERYLARNMSSPEAIFSLAKQFFDMIRELEVNDVAHGDLQHGNILVTAEGLRLVDYDSLFVPGLKGFPSLELGHPNYQHPERDSSHFDPTVDNFSTWLIYVSLICLAIDGDLYRRFECGDDCLIFKRKDLLAPETSPVFRELLEHESSEIRSLVTLINRLLWLSPNAIPPLDIPERDWSFLPTGPTTPSERVNSDVQPISVVSNQSDSFRDALIQTSDQSIQQAFPSSKKKKARSLLAREFARRVQKTLEKILDKSFKKLDLKLWCRCKLSEADSHYSRGDYFRASELYKLIESHRHVLNENEIMNVLIRLGCCFIQMNHPEVANNFFVLAAYTETTNERALEKKRFFQALCSKDEVVKTSAVRILTEILKLQRIDLVNACNLTQVSSIASTGDGVIFRVDGINSEVIANLKRINQFVEFLDWARTAIWRIPIEKNDWREQILAVQDLARACANVSKNGMYTRVLVSELLAYASLLFENLPNDNMLALSFGLGESHLLSSGEVSSVLMKTLPLCTEEELFVVLKEMEAGSYWHVVVNKLTLTLNKLGPSPHALKTMRAIWSFRKEKRIVDEILWLSRFEDGFIEDYLRDDLSTRIIAEAESASSVEPLAVLSLVNACSSLGSLGDSLRFEIAERAVEVALRQNKLEVVFQLIFEVDNLNFEELFVDRIKEKLMSDAKTQFHPGCRSLSALVLFASRLESLDVIASIIDEFYTVILANKEAYSLDDLEFAQELATTYTVPLKLWDDLHDLLLLRQLERPPG